MNNFDAVSDSALLNRGQISDVTSVLSASSYGLEQTSPSQTSASLGTTLADDNVLLDTTDNFGLSNSLMETDNTFPGEKYSSLANNDVFSDGSQKASATDSSYDTILGSSPSKGEAASPLRSDPLTSLANEDILDQKSSVETRLRYEAEDLSLVNYRVKSNKKSSGRKIASLTNRKRAGTISGVFDGEAGTYQVKVGYYDESDGVSSANVIVNGDSQTFSFDKDLPGRAPSPRTLTEQITHQSIQLEQGDLFEIAGNADRKEFARFDYIEFTAIDGGLIEVPTPPTEPTTGGPTDIPADPDNGPIALPFIPGNLESMSASVKVESFVPTGTGKTYYVSPNGSDSGLGTKEQPWKTISYAASEESAVTAGDTILVQSGEYTEQVNLEKSGSAELGHIVLKADGVVTLFDPTPEQENWQDAPIKSSGQSHWVIDGFRIENTSWAGISLQDASEIVVQNNSIYKSGASGIIVLPDSYFEGGEKEVTSSNITILNNTIEKANNRWAGRGDPRGTQEALSVWGVDGFEVAGNVVNGGTREGIDIKTGSRNGSVHSNIVTGVASISGTPGGYNGGPAIYVDGNRADTFNVDIYDNTVYGNTAEGIVIGDEVPEQGDVKDIRVFNNLVYDNGKLGVNSGAGLSVSSNVSDVELTNNTVADNVQALVIDGTDFTKGQKIFNVVVRDNIFANSTYRNGLVEDADGLVIDNNLFTDSFGLIYQTGSGLTNLIEANNRQVDSVRFSNQAAKDYRLTAESAAVDAGSNALPQNVVTDNIGNPRRRGAAIDIGAFELGAQMMNAIDAGSRIVNTVPFSTAKGMQPTGIAPTVSTLALNTPKFASQRLVS